MGEVVPYNELESRVRETSALVPERTTEQVKVKTEPLDVDSSYPTMDPVHHEIAQVPVNLECGTSYWH